jgi:hypothetical protein
VVEEGCLERRLARSTGDTVGLRGGLLAEVVRQVVGEAAAEAEARAEATERRRLGAAPVLRAQIRVHTRPLLGRLRLPRPLCPLQLQLLLLLKLLHHRHRVRLVVQRPCGVVLGGLAVGGVGGRAN